jgi:hypothetical protein
MSEELKLDWQRDNLMGGRIFAYVGKFTLYVLDDAHGAWIWSISLDGEYLDFGDTSLDITSQLAAEKALFDLVKPVAEIMESEI